MKRSTTLLSILLSLAFLLVLPAEAQRQQHHGQKGHMMARPDSMSGSMMGMMQGRMGPGMMQMMQGIHQTMMQSPMHRARMMMFALPALADTLGLSEQQVQQMNELKAEGMTRHQEQRAQMMAQRKELTGLFEDDQHPAPDAVRRHLMAMAETRARQRGAMYEMSHQMRQVLTDEQRQTLDTLTPKQKMHQMMSRMSMMDMMQMMRSMHGAMMGRRMMQGAMKQMMQNMSMQHGGMRQQDGRQRQNRQNQ